MAFTVSRVHHEGPYTRKWGVWRSDGTLLAVCELKGEAQMVADALNYDPPNGKPHEDTSFSQSENNPPSENKLRERFAAIAHAVWADWMRYLFGKCIRNGSGMVSIPVSLAARWERQISTPYAQLSEDEKESDRAIADRYLRATGIPIANEDE